MRQHRQSMPESRVDDLVEAVLDRLGDRRSAALTGGGEQKTQVISAVPLNQNELRRAALIMARQFNGSFEPENVVDPSILGGLIFRVNDQVVDLSLAKGLEELAGMTK